MRTLLAASILAVVATACSSGPAQTESNSASKAAKPAEPTGIAGAPKSQTACEVLTAAEIAAFLKVPEVKKDDLNSGKNQFTEVDLCYWYVKEGSPEGISVTLRTAATDDEGGRMLAFSSAKVDAVEHDVKRSQAMQTVAVGDEAAYSPYSIGQGGSIVARVGSVVLTMTGSTSKDALVAMAKLAAQKM